MTTFGGPLNNQLQCSTGRTTTLNECRALNSKWFNPLGTAPCDADILVAAQYLENSAAPLTCRARASKAPGSCVFYPPVVWAGAGCPRPCATKAIQTGKNPMRYCRSINTWPTFNDGGCKLYFDCAISCSDTCNRQRYCEWRGGVCQNKYSLAPKAPLCIDGTARGTAPCL